MSALTSSPTGLIFTPAGSKPLSQARVGRTAGGVKRVYCKDVKGYGVELKGARTTKLELPKRKQDSLGVTHRYLVFQVNVPAGRDFAVELTVSDTNHFRYRLILSTAIKSAGASNGGDAGRTGRRSGGSGSNKRNPGNPLHFQLPLRMAKTKWSNVVVDVVALTHATFGDVHGAMFRCVDSVAITASCRLRNVFSALENPISSPNAVPAHLALRLVNGRPPRTIFVDGGNGNENNSRGSMLSPTSPRERKVFSSFPTAPSTRSATTAANGSASQRTPSRTPRLPLPSPVPTLAHASGAAAAAAMVSPSLPSPPATVKLAFGTRVRQSPKVVDSAAGPSPQRSARTARARPTNKNQQIKRHALSSRSPPLGNENQEKAAYNYWDELPRRRFPKSTDENDEFPAAGVAAASLSQPHRIPSAMDRYGEGSPLSPPTNTAAVLDAMPSPSTGSEAEALSAEMRAIGGPTASSSEMALTPPREDAKAAQEREPEATPSREYDGEEERDDMYDEYEDGAEEGDDDGLVENGRIDDGIRVDEEDVKEAMAAIRERVFVEDAEEEDEPFARSYDEGGARDYVEDDAAYDDDYEEGEVEAAVYADDGDAENDEEAAARIADLYAQLELKRRQIAQMEAEFSDGEVYDDGEENGRPEYEDVDDYEEAGEMEEEETARPPLENDMFVGDVSDDMVNMGAMEEDELSSGFIAKATEEGDGDEDDEELIFDPILDCYYSPRTNTYFERQ